MAADYRLKIPYGNTREQEKLFNLHRIVIGYIKS